MTFLNLIKQLFPLQIVSNYETKICVRRFRAAEIFSLLVLDRFSFPLQCQRFWLRLTRQQRICNSLQIYSNWHRKDYLSH